MGLAESLRRQLIADGERDLREPSANSPYQRGESSLFPAANFETSKAASRERASPVRS